MSMDALERSAQRWTGNWFPLFNTLGFFCQIVVPPRWRPQLRRSPPSPRGRIVDYKDGVVPGRRCDAQMIQPELWLFIVLVDVNAAQLLPAADDRNVGIIPTTQMNKERIGCEEIGPLRAVQKICIRANWADGDSDLSRRGKEAARGSDGEGEKRLHVPDTPLGTKRRRHIGLVPGGRGHAPRRPGTELFVMSVY
ncbi:hypothetical protein EYF80_019545 [Liparis tanakae]|uniref:Uncharacterized protein n=1 Tax=Liparis tanakae TaxID=230148 RepID=A0A4Z2HXN6_9TELE|nr:hypothetical protein EYF80_019545 [Liparis tanakae]